MTEKPEKNLCRHQIYDIYLSFKKKSTLNQLTNLELHSMYAYEAFKGQQHYPPWILSALILYVMVQAHNSQSLCTKFTTD